MNVPSCLLVRVLAAGLVTLAIRLAPMLFSASVSLVTLLNVKGDSSVVVAVSSAATGGVLSRKWAVDVAEASAALPKNLAVTV